MFSLGAPGSAILSKERRIGRLGTEGAEMARSNSKSPARNLAADRAAKGLPKLTITRFEALPAKEKAAKAERIRKLREGGTPWPEIVAATGIPGGITGRKILRLYFGAKGSALVAPSYDRSAAEANRAKAASAARPRKAGTNRTKAEASKAAGTRTRARSAK